MKRNACLVFALAFGIAHAGWGGQASAGDQWLSRPIDDRTFKTYLDFFAYDRQVPFDFRVTGSQEEQGAQRERLSFQSTPGVRVHAILTKPAGQIRNAPAVIFLHGGGAKGKDSPFVVAFSTFLSRAGWVVAAPDLQYFGERTTDLLTTFDEREKHDRLYNQPSVYLAWITQTVKDVSRTYDVLVQERDVDPARVAIAGFSRGAMAATIAAAADRRLAGAALLFAGHFDALEASHLPAACPANYIGRISPRRVLMINGKQDSDMIKDSAVEPLFKLAHQPKQIIWTDGGHGFMSEEHRAALVQWLRGTPK